MVDQYLTPLPNEIPLNRLKDGVLELALNLLALVISGRLAVKGEESTEVELRRLQELDLANVNLRHRGLVYALLREF